MRKLIDLLNGGLRFHDNFDADIQAFTTSSPPDTEMQIAHALKRVPTGFLVLKIDRTGTMYAGVGTWTSQFLYLRCSASAAVVTVMIF